jgi:hypothetical protein
VDAGRWIQDQVAGRQLDFMLAILVGDDQLAAVIFFRIAQEQGRRHVGAQPLAAAGDAAHRAVHVCAVVFAAGVAVEQRRACAQRQRGGKEQRVVGQRLQHDLAQLHAQRRAVRQLAVLLDLGARVPTVARPSTHCDSSRRRRMSALVRGQYARDVQHHDELS